MHINNNREHHAMGCQQINVWKIYGQWFYKKNWLSDTCCMFLLYCRYGRFLISDFHIWWNKKPMINMLESMISNWLTVNTFNINRSIFSLVNLIVLSSDFKFLNKTLVSEDETCQNSKSRKNFFFNLTRTIFPKDLRVTRTPKSLFSSAARCF